MSAWTCRHTDGKVVQKIVPPRPRIPYWKGLGADSEEKHEPASDIDTALVDSLKVLDPEGPIREADMGLFHSITWSAVSSNFDGTVRPSAFAILRLITRSNFVGCCTGRSAGFVPLSIRST